MSVSIPHTTHRVNTPNLKTHYNSRKTHCKQGHPYDADNTRYDGRRRRCKLCEGSPSPRARQLFDFVHACGLSGAHTTAIVIHIWGRDYLRAAWRVNFDRHVYLARRYAASLGLAIVNERGVYRLVCLDSEAA